MPQKRSQPDKAVFEDLKECSRNKTGKCISKKLPKISEIVRENSKKSETNKLKEKLKEKTKGLSIMIPTNSQKNKSNIQGNQGNLSMHQNLGNNMQNSINIRENIGQPIQGLIGNPLDAQTSQLILSPIFMPNSGYGSILNPLSGMSRLQNDSFPPNSSERHMFFNSPESAKAFKKPQQPNNTEKP